MRFLRSWLTKKWFLGCATGVVLATTGALIAHAAGETGIPRVVHYEGSLEKNGIPCDTSSGCGTVNAVFTLDNGDDSSLGGLTFDYSVSAMPVVAGRFVVDIGAGATVPDWVFDQASHVYLTVKVNGTSMNGRQKIAPVPYAVRAAEAVNFNVKQSATVGGSLSAGSATVGGTLSAGATAIGGLSAGSATFSGNVSVPNLQVSTGGSSNVPHDCKWVSSGSGIDQTTRLCPSGKFAMAGSCEGSPMVTTTNSHPIFDGLSRPVGWKCYFSSGSPAFANLAEVNCCAL